MRRVSVFLAGARPAAAPAAARPRARPRGRRGGGAGTADAGTGEAGTADAGSAKRQAGTADAGSGDRDRGAAGPATAALSVKYNVNVQRNRLLRESHDRATVPNTVQYTLTLADWRCSV